MVPTFAGYLLLGSGGFCFILSFGLCIYSFYRSRSSFRSDKVVAYLQQCILLMGVLVSALQTVLYYLALCQIPNNNNSIGIYAVSRSLITAFFMSFYGLLVLWFLTVNYCGSNSRLAKRFILFAVSIYTALYSISIVVYVVFCYATSASVLVHQTVFWVKVLSIGFLIILVLIISLWKANQATHSALADSETRQVLIRSKTSISGLCGVYVVLTVFAVLRLTQQPPFHRYMLYLPFAGDPMDAGSKDESQVPTALWFILFHCLPLLIVEYAFSPFQPRHKTISAAASSEYDPDKHSASAPYLSHGSESTNPDAEPLAPPVVVQDPDRLGQQLYSDSSCDGVEEDGVTRHNYNYNYGTISSASESDCLLEEYRQQDPEDTRKSSGSHARSHSSHNNNNNNNYSNNNFNMENSDHNNIDDNNI